MISPVFIKLFTANQTNVFSTFKKFQNTTNSSQYFFKIPTLISVSGGFPKNYFKAFIGGEIIYIKQK